MKTLLRPCLFLLASMTVLTGAFYPVAVTGICRLAFADQASGSLLIHGDGRLAGSALIAQPFDDPRFFWGRPSATARHAQNAAASGGSNLGPSNPALHASVAQRIKALRDAEPHNQAAIPVDLVTASGSGLDPHISPAAALYQAGRVARIRGLEAGRVRALVNDQIAPRTLGILGEPRVNVLVLNRALEAFDPKP